MKYVLDKKKCQDILNFGKISEIPLLWYHFSNISFHAVQFQKYQFYKYL